MEKIALAGTSKRSAAEQSITQMKNEKNLRSHKRARCSSLKTRNFGGSKAVWTPKPNRVIELINIV